MPALLSLCVAISFVAPGTPAKWRVSLPGNRTVIGRTADEAEARAKRLADFESITVPIAPAAPDLFNPNADRRRAEETSLELLKRLDALSAFDGSAGSVHDAVAETMARYRALPSKSEAAITLLNEGLCKAAFERALVDLSEKKQPTVPSAELFAEPAPVSALANIPAPLRGRYVALLERLEDLRPPSTSPSSSVKRETVLRGAFKDRTAIRLSEATAASTAKAITLKYRLVSLSTPRKEVAVVDQWTIAKGAYSLVSTKVSPLSAPDYAAAAAQKLLAEAMAENTKIQERLEHQRQEAARRMRERQEAERQEKERLRREEELRRQEQEKREQEERERQEREDKVRRLEQARRDYADAENNLNRVRQDRDRATQDLQYAYSERQQAEREVGPYRQRVDDLEGRVRQQEQNIQQAKSEGKSTAILEGVLADLKGQLRGAEHDYNQAQSRVRSADNRIYELQSAVSNLEGEASRLSGTLNELRGLIASLGG